MTKFRKILICGLLFSLCPAFIFSQTVVKRVAEDKYDFILLQKARDAFETGDYGTAVSVAEEAKVSRINECDYKNYVFQNLQKLSYVRRVGDNLTDIISVLQEHEQSEALNLINVEIHRYGIEYFSNSYALLIQKNLERKAYPEADFLVGKIYRYEGEVELSKSYLLKAYENRVFLDVSDEQYDILYALAELSYYTDNFEDYEKYLLLVLKDNRFYKDTAFMNAIVKIIDGNSDSSVEKFFNLYRCENYFSIRALNELAVFYSRRSEVDKALRCSALASITAVTKITECLSDRLSHYKFNGLGDMLEKASKYEDVVEWGNNNNIWELFYNFGEITGTSGYVVFSRKVYMILSQYEPEDYWKKRCASKLIE